MKSKLNWKVTTSTIMIMIYKIVNKIKYFGVIIKFSYYHSINNISTSDTND